MFSGELFNCRRILSAELVYTLAPARVTEAGEASLAPALLSRHKYTFNTMVM